MFVIALFDIILLSQSFRQQASSPSICQPLWLVGGNFICYVYNNDNESLMKRKPISFREYDDNQSVKHLQLYKAKLFLQRACSKTYCIHILSVLHVEGAILKHPQFIPQVKTRFQKYLWGKTYVTSFPLKTVLSGMICICLRHYNQGSLLTIRWANPKEKKDDTLNKPCYVLLTSRL